DIEVRRSARRKKTVAVSKEIDTYVLRTPVRYSVEANVRSLTELLNRLSARDHSSAADLVEVAEEMSRRYFEGRLRPTSIRWVTNQNVSRGASTTTATGDLRSYRRATYVLSWLYMMVVVP